MRKPKSVLGLVNNYALEQLEISEAGAVYGAAISGPTFTRALLLHGSMNRCEVFVNPRRLKVVTQDVKTTLRHATRQKIVKVHEYRDLLKGVDGLGVTLWFDAYARFWEADYIRSRWSTRLYPITGLIHSISYQTLLHWWALPLLLADTFPCDSILCYSQAARRALSRMLNYVSSRFRRRYKISLKYRGRLDVIPLGVDTDVFRPRDKVSVRRQLGLPLRDCIILYLGRFSTVDKADLFPSLRVIRDLMTQSVGRSLFLLLAGSPPGPCCDSINRHLHQLGLPPRVRVMAAPHENRHLLFSAADVFISPSDSIQENLGSTPIEAMASGVPQVVADWDGYRETVRHGKTGFLVPVHWAQCDSDLCDLAPLDRVWSLEFDHGSMAQSVAMDLRMYAKYLNCLIKSESLRTAMGEASRKRALAIYSWPSVVKQYEALGAELSQRTAGVKYEPRRVESYARPSYFKMFNHYATNCLDDNSMLTQGSMAEDLGNITRVMPSYHPAMEYRLLDPKLLASAIALMRRRTRERSRRRNQVSSLVSSGVTMGEMVYNLNCHENRHPDDVRRHLMWLLKYGFLEVGSS